MDYRIEKREAFKVICRKKQVNKLRGDTATEDISAFWKECTENGATEFFPQSKYEYGSGVEFEVYPSADVQDPDYSCEIWVAVKAKNQ